MIRCQNWFLVPAGSLRLLGLAALLLLAHLVAPAQCKTFKLSDRGDTLNCVDHSGKKQGKWVLKVAEQRGERGYEEEGTYVDDKKEGVWRRYSPEGDLLAVERYRWGLLNGKSQYYSVLGLEREESWWAMDPGKQFDTIDVPDLYEDGKYTQVVVKNEGYSMRNGTWTWYDPTTGFVQRTEDFIRDSAVSPLGAFGIKAKKPTGEPGKPGDPKKTEKPAVVQEWEKKNSGKKKVKVRDGSTGY